MKVYVDELPKSCSNCKFCTSDYYCKLINKDVFDYDKPINRQVRYSKCSLKTITDYTKQVRKEVCEEIRRTLFEYLKVKSMEELESLSLLDSTLTYDVITDKLDQI